MPQPLGNTAPKRPTAQDHRPSSLSGRGTSGRPPQPVPECHRIRHLGAAENAAAPAPLAEQRHVVRHTTTAEQQRDPDLRHQSWPEEAPVFLRTAFDPVGQAHPAEEVAKYRKPIAVNEAADTRTDESPVSETLYAGSACDIDDVAPSGCIPLRVVLARKSLRPTPLVGAFPYAAPGSGMTIPP